MADIVVQRIRTW